ncbi:glycosyltransferase [Paracoccus laeviglucosivorans]|uniref:Predicted glycosyl transferase n=1 Tax=Paracoccus laeviglucosivorans TaxID=1197861 RepID=A0A521EPK9_9RHOB|nr:glycosyltransferase [Paracoccus laeviglucosivorans]SMO85853.1 Predicted glycosyl transferase [Paracoccus laeviglucosivorans]
MRDLAPPPQPFGYFVHHQGCGHAERCAALVNALPASRRVTVFCARPDILPQLPSNAQIVTLPSLFERQGDETDMDHLPTPATLHCAPLGWPGIRRAMGILAAWFADADPALIICDVSAEIAQFARICAVPHVKVLQHGDRSDPGHRAAYDGAVGLLAPFAEALAQPEWDAAMRAKTHFAGGLGLNFALPRRAEARARLGIAPDAQVALVLSGGGGDGLAVAPLGIAARTFPQWRWLTIGKIQDDWHATAGGNLCHRGWVDNPQDYLAAANLVVSSAGNTTCAQVLAAARPWIVVPEWRYFDEQVEKARALSRAGAALHLLALPASAHRWQEAVEAALAGHDPSAQARLLSPDPAKGAACWLEALAQRLWQARSLKQEA